MVANEKAFYPRLKSNVRHMFYAAKTKLKKWYSEFADILDSDEDRLSLQYNQYSGKTSRLFPRSFKWKEKKA